MPEKSNVSIGTAPPIQSSSGTSGPLRNKSMYCKPPSTMTSVVEEQITDKKGIHLPPVTDRETLLSPDIAGHTQCQNEIKPSTEDIKGLEQTNQPAHMKAQPKLTEELMNNSKLEKKSIDQLGANHLKKATNPSISSLRALSQPNYPTTSSTSTTVTKGSSRAEFFAAKLHDAIKHDVKNNNGTVETFVYDANSVTTPNTEQQLQDGNEMLHSLNRDSERHKPSNINSNEYLHNHSTDQIDTDNVKERLQSVFATPESPTSTKFTEENFDMKSASSIGSRKHSRRRSNNRQGDHIQAMSKYDSDDRKSVNQLRQITSRLFDNKPVQPRRYSNLEGDFNDDSFEDDLEYEPSLSFMGNNDHYSNIYKENQQLQQQQLQKHQQRPQAQYTNNNPYGLSMNEGNADYDDVLSNDYFDFANNDNSYNSNYCQKQNIIGNGINFPDYGSVGDKKRIWRRNEHHNSPHDFTSNRVQRLKQIRNFCYSLSLIIMLVSIGFVSGFILATNKELQNFKVLEVSNAIVSQEELVFDILISAFNPGLMSVTVDSAQLDIFAKTRYVKSDNSKTNYETILLGTIESLEIPLYFQGGFLNRKRDRSDTQIKIKNPCSYDHDFDDDKEEQVKTFDEFDNKKYQDLGHGRPGPMNLLPISHSPDPRWLNISRHPFDLLIRGAMMYKLPLSSQNHTVSISYTSYIDPGDDFIDY